MYRIVLVEDEYEIRQGLKTFIGTIEYFRVVGEAKNGIEALEVIGSLLPDVVLTDIKMAGMDGLKLAEIIHNTYKGIKVVILSGYAEFDFVKSAIKIGVYEYLLKSMPEEEMRSFFFKLGQELDVIRQKDIEAVHIRKKFKEGLTLMQDEFIYEMLEDSVLDLDFIRERFEFLEIPVDVNDAVIVSVICTANKQDMEMISVQDKTLLRFAITNIIKESIGKRENGFGLVGMKLESFIILGRSGSSYRDIKDFSNELRCNIEKYINGFYNMEFITGIGRFYPSITGMSLSFSEAMEALKLRFVDTREKCFCFEPACTVESDGSKPFSHDMEKNLLSSISEGNVPACIKVIENIFDDIRKNISRNNYSNLFQHLSSLLYSIDKVLNGYDDSLNHICGQDVFSQNRLLVSKSLDTVFEWFRDTAVKAAEAVLKRLAETDYISNTKIEVVKKYIYNNLKSEITLLQLADHMHMNPAYLSIWFKRKMGVNYIDYVRRCRMEEAKILLKKIDIKIYEVANKVGYEYGKYFINAFKDNTGYTPQEYRRMNIQT